MHFTLSITFAICASTLVRSLPVVLLASSDLLKNGQDAQALNAEWKSLTATSPCGNFTTACVENSIAKCENDTWNTSAGACSKSQQCFALPSVTSGGTTIACTSERNALSIINSTGATGDITGTNTTNSASNSPQSATRSRTSETSMTAAHSAKSASATAPERVTVTVTVTPVETPLPLTINTVSPEEASSILSSILAQGQPTSSSAASASAAPATISQTLASSAPTPATGTPGSIITLVAATATGSIVASASVSATGIPGNIITPVAATGAAPASTTAAPSTATGAADTSGGYGRNSYHLLAHSLTLDVAPSRN